MPPHSPKKLHAFCTVVIPVTSYILYDYNVIQKSKCTTCAYL